MSFYQESSLSNKDKLGYSASEFSISNLNGKFISASTAANSTTYQIAQDFLASKVITTGSASASSGQVIVDSLNNGRSGALSQYTSEIEAAILRSTSPININESEEITFQGNRGIWANRAEVVGWKGVLPIEKYQINEDPNPEVITKRIKQQLEYVQELAIRYLRPPTPPAPGEIIITQEPNTVTPPAPPLIIRQQPPRPATPEPLVIREAPPQPPTPVGRKLITISGKRLPPAPRKVVIERLAPLPSKPQAVIIERWLPYSQSKRRVIFQKSNNVDPVIVKPRNVIVQWEGPQVVIKKDYKYLGVVKANPAEYVSRFGASLKTTRDMPQFVLDIKTPEGLVLAADYKYSSFYELEGDVSALKLIDLDKEGLGDYKAYLQRINGGSFDGGSIANILEDIYRNVSVSQNGRINLAEAERLLIRFSGRLGKQENEVRAFFRKFDVAGDNSFDLDELKRTVITNLF